MRSEVVMEKQLEDIRNIIASVQALDITPVEAIWRIDVVLRKAEQSGSGMEI
jgi:Asp-tRNA(Asn)/Glu-tRNA(Gln) amidotransferase C subunit